MPQSGEGGGRGDHTTLKDFMSKVLIENWMRILVVQDVESD